MLYTLSDRIVVDTERLYHWCINSMLTLTASVLKVDYGLFHLAAIAGITQKVYT